MSEKIRHVLRAIGEDPELLHLLRVAPTELADRFELSDADTARLEQSTLVLTLVQNPLLERAGKPPGTVTDQGTMTFTHTPPGTVTDQGTMTFTHTPPSTVTDQGTMTFTHTPPGTVTDQPPTTMTFTGHRQGPRTLEELSHERLVEVTERVLTDPDYAERVRTFLGL